MKAYYHDSNMPMTRYILVTVTGDLRHLLIDESSFEISESLADELRDAWLAINSAWTEIVDDSDSNAYTESLHRINELKARLMMYRMAVDVCRVLPLPHFIKVLSDEFGYEELDPDHVGFGAALDRILVELSADEIELQALESKVSRKEEGIQGNNGRVTEQQYDDLLFTINQSEGTVYKMSELNVRQFAVLLNRLRRRGKPAPKPLEE
jgi:hypothetical protein